MKTIREKIEIMEAYNNKEKIEVRHRDTSTWSDATLPCWNWDMYDYRIKEEKKTVIIEKWLCKNKLHIYYIVESSDIDSFHKNEKVKLLETYKVEL